MFLQVTVYVSLKIFSLGTELPKLTFQFYGGKISEKIDSGLSFYFVPEDLEDCELEALKALRRSKCSATRKSNGTETMNAGKNAFFKIACVEWISKCLEAGRLVDESQYLL